MNRHFVLQAAAAVLALASYVGASPDPAQAQTYQVTDVGALPGHAASRARGLNLHAQVTGHSDPSNNGFVGTAFLWTNGVMQNLGTFGGAWSIGESINDAGQVAGSASNSRGGTHAFLYSNGKLTNIAGKAKGNSSGIAINNSGHIVGRITVTYDRPFYWSPGTGFVYLGGLGGKTVEGSANAINDNGLIAGWSQNAAGLNTATLWSGTQMIALPPLIAGGSGVANGINNNGDVVGQATGSLDASGNGIPHAVLWRNGVAIDLWQRGQASDINNLGQVVGNRNLWEDINGNNLCDPGEVRDLNTLLDPVTGAGWVITLAASINDNGQIAGLGTLNGVRRAVVLTPMP